MISTKISGNANTPIVVKTGMPDAKIQTSAAEQHKI